MSRDGRWILVGVILGVLFIVILPLCWYLATPAMYWCDAIQMGRSNPRLSIVPKPLADTTRSQSSGEKIAKFGYSFEVPWHKSEPDVVRGPVAVYIFSNGEHVAFMDLARSELAGGQDRMTNRAFITAIGPYFDAHSQYELLSSELNVTPNDISLFFWTRRSRRNALLLNFKNTFFKWDKISAIYSVDLSGTPGFQIGDPLHDPTVELRWFDTSEDELQIFFTSKVQTRISQQDINCVIQSLRVTQTADREADRGSKQ